MTDPKTMTTNQETMTTNQETIEVANLDPFALKETMMDPDQSNPFYLPMGGSPLRYTKSKFLAQEYDCLYIMCLANSFNTVHIELVKNFYKKNSTIKELTMSDSSTGKARSSGFLHLIKAPFSLVNNGSIRSGLISISRENLEPFNDGYYDLKPKELVYLMLQTKSSDVESWLGRHHTDISLNNYLRQKIFTSYYHLEDAGIKTLPLIDDFQYWKNKKHCAVSNNNKFSQRKFNLELIQKWNLKNSEELDKELQKFLNKISSKNNPSDAKCYAQEITSVSRDKKESVVLDNVKNDTMFYRPPRDTEIMIGKAHMEELLTSHSLGQRERYVLLCNLLMSKNYCHFVINNRAILQSNLDLLLKYKPVFRYVMGYAWATMYLEEMAIKTRIKEADRIVFDIETASMLPTFPFCYEAAHLNPYFSCMVAEKMLNMAKNINGVRTCVEGQGGGLKDSAGIVDLPEFKRRLNIFMTGDENINLLEGANWSNMVISGGCMAAILPKTNPLMNLFPKQNGNYDIKRFFEEYYGKSDIDIASSYPNILDFISNVKYLKQVIYQNLVKSGKPISPSDINIIKCKSLNIYISSAILRAKCARGEIPFKYDKIVSDRENRNIKFYFYELYLEQKRMSNEKNRMILGDKANDDEYFEIIDYCELEKSNIIISDAPLSPDVVPNKSAEMSLGIETVYFLKEGNDPFIKFSETLKYKIQSKYLSHSFEIFRINYDEFFSCISRFHLPCVRSYYNGKTCYMLPSAITSYQTLCNIDFKYFMGSNDPISILNKYRKRGYGMVLNEVEIRQYMTQIVQNDRYKKEYAITDVKNSILGRVVGSLDINDEYFKPCKYFPGDLASGDVLKTDYLVVNKPYIKSKEDLLKVYRDLCPKYPSEFIEFRTIGPDGQIEVPKEWIIEASYDLIN